MTPEEHRQARLAAQAEKYRTNIAGLRVIRDETSAELCRHHVPLSNCIDCRATRTPTPTTEEA